MADTKNLKIANFLSFKSIFNKILSYVGINTDTNNQFKIKIDFKHLFTSKVTSLDANSLHN